MTQLRRLAAHLRPYLTQMAGAGLLLIGVAAINLTILWVVRGLVDSVLIRHDLSALNAIIAELLVLFLIQGILSMGHSYLTALIGQRVVTDFRIRLFEHLERLSVSFFAKRRTGELMSRLTNDVGVIQNTAVTVPIDLAKHLVTLIGGVGILFYMNWRLCALILAMLPLVVLTARFFGRKLKAISTTVQDETAGASTIIEEVVSGIRMVKSFVREREELRRFTSQVEKTVEAVMQRAKVLAVFIPVITFLTLGAAAAVLWFGGHQVITGAMTPGDLVAFILYGGILIGPFGSFARLFSTMKEVQGATTRVFEILDTPPQVTDHPQAVAMPPIVGAAAFHKVSFHYDPEIPVLHEVSFGVKPGEVVALVGPSGAGKSTLINLLHRFYDPTEGRIEIDGRDIRKVSLESLYRQIGLVPQETILFGGTIRENILFGQSNASEAEVVEAARAANAHDFIRGFPKGYDTIVGEKGINLSGGQRQRIAIARAILKDPRLLMLDEATSSLDNESERLIQEALERLMRGRTTFVIAHRLTTVQAADRILVMDKGRIVEEGTHEKLLERQGLYHHLYTLRLAGVLA